MKRKAAFLTAISRDDLDVNNVEEYRICSRHLVSGKLVKTLEETNIDWADSTMNFYTGLSNLKILKAIFDHVSLTLPSERSSQCMQAHTISRLYVSNVKIVRLNSLVIDLAY